MKRKSNITRQLRAAVAAALLGGIFSLSPAALALPVGGTSVGNTATSKKTVPERLQALRHSFLVFLAFDSSPFQYMVYFSN